MADEFKSEVELDVTVPERELRSARQTIEDGIGDIETSITVNGGGGVQNQLQPREPESGQFMAIEGVEQRVIEQTTITEDIRDIQRQGLEYAEAAAIHLESIEDDVTAGGGLGGQGGGGGGGGGGLLGRLALGSTGQAILGGGVIAGAGAASVASGAQEGPYTDLPSGLTEALEGLSGQGGPAGPIGAANPVIGGLGAMSEFARLAQTGMEVGESIRGMDLSQELGVDQLPDLATTLAVDAVPGLETAMGIGDVEPLEQILEPQGVGNLGDILSLEAAENQFAPGDLINTSNPLGINDIFDPGGGDGDRGPRDRRPPDGGDGFDVPVPGDINIPDQIDLSDIGVDVSVSVDGAVDIAGDIEQAVQDALGRDLEQTEQDLQDRIDDLKRDIERGLGGGPGGR